MLTVTVIASLFLADDNIPEKFVSVDRIMFIHSTKYKIYLS